MRARQPRRDSYVLILRPLPGVPAIPALRAALKALKRHYGLQCLSIKPVRRSEKPCTELLPPAGR